MTRAVEEDQKRNYKDAYYAYCEGLQYFVPLIASETDVNKRLHLQQQATTYMERAEEIKRCYTEAFGHQNSQIKSDDQVDASSSTTENPVVQALKPASNYKQLRKTAEQRTYPFEFDCRNWDVYFLFSDSLFASTRQVQDALEIGRQAELYSYEQNHVAALDRYTSALKVLVPLLPQEPPGTRKELLQKQVMEWMKEAESIKALAMAHKATENKSGHQHCCLQWITFRIVHSHFVIFS